MDAGSLNGLLPMARAPAIDSPALDKPRQVMRSTMAAFYTLAGLVHITAPDKFLPIVPDRIPFPRQVVLVTGICGRMTVGLTPASTPPSRRCPGRPLP